MSYVLGLRMSPRPGAYVQSVRHVKRGNALLQGRRDMYAPRTCFAGGDQAGSLVVGGSEEAAGSACMSARYILGSVE